MTGIVPIMLAVWGALVALLLALKIYTASLTRDEADQLVLDSAFDHLKAEQAALIARVNRIEPITRATMWLVVAMTVGVVGYYLMDVLNQFK